MTIDMHRDESLRDYTAFVLFGSRKADLKLPASSDLSSYTATRNLPDDNPAHAVVTMEETCVPAAKLSPQQKKRPRRRVHKPALCYTVYWEADSDQQTELSEIDNSLTAMFATHLQTLIVGRSDYPRRTHVIVNVIDPSTGRLGIVKFPYFDLMYWHLTTICDKHAVEALDRGKVATTAESLNRQDHRLLDLPPLFAEAVRGVPGYRFDSNTLHMIWRAGPSTFHTADFIDTVHSNINYDETLTRRARNTPLNPEIINRSLNRKRDIRRKIVLGDFFEDLADHDETFSQQLYSSLDKALANRFDRSLFELHTLSTPKDGLLCNFYPKKHKREWCAAYAGSPSDLPDDLIGYAIQVQPHPPNAPWYGRITEIAVRSADNLIVRTTARDYIALYRDGWSTISEASPS